MFVFVLDCEDKNEMRCVNSSEVNLLCTVFIWNVCMRSMYVVIHRTFSVVDAFVTFEINFQ